MKLSVAILIAICGLHGALAGEGDPLPVGATAPQEFVDRFHAAKFGVFVQWGLATQAGGEWAMSATPISAGEYRGLLQKFNPEKFDAAQWARQFKDAGAKYVVLTAKGFDGFCLFDSKLTDFDVMGTPFGRDVLKEVTNACRAAGLPIFYYYSLADWNHAEYWPWGWTGTRIPGRPRGGDNAEYIAYYQGQLCELCTNYGSIDGIILDGEWDRGQGFYDLERTYAIIHKLQPQALVANSHGRRPMAGEDYQMLDIAAQANIRMPFVPFAVNMEIEPAGKKRIRNANEMLSALISTAGRGGNLHAVIRPGADGAIPPQQAEVLGKMGEWLGQHGKALFNTRPGPWVGRDWGACTWSLNRIYIHLLQRPGREMLLSEPPGVVQKAMTFDGVDVEFEAAGNDAAGGELMLTLPDWDNQKVVDRIIELRFDGKLEQAWITPAVRPGAAGVLSLSAESAQLYGGSFAFVPGLMWNDPNDRAVWTVKVPRTGRYHAVVTYSCPAPTAGCQFTVGVDGSRLIGRIEPTGASWQEQDTIELPGTIELPAGRATVTLTATGEPKWFFMQLFRIDLRPAEVP